MIFFLIYYRLYLLEKIHCADQGRVLYAGLCASLVRAGIARSCALSAGWLCAGVVRSVERNGVCRLCARRVQSLVRIERHKVFAVFRKAFSSETRL